MDAEPNPISNQRARSGPAGLPIQQADLRAILSNLSHELCRPLVSLRAGFDLLLGDAARPISGEQRGHVQSMVGLCDDLLRLTRSYLDYAGLVQNATPPRLGTFTVAAMIREIDREFAAVAAGRKIEWSCSLDGPDASVITDASRCQQVFGHIVSNALRYTPEGGHVRVSGRHDSESWSVTVADNGPGIPHEEVQRVFEPFYRLARDERSRSEGTGLGLAICRELVDQLGGRISLTSILGQGTRVVLQFPLRMSS